MKITITTTTPDYIAALNRSRGNDLTLLMSSDYRELIEGHTWVSGSFRGDNCPQRVRNILKSTEKILGTASDDDIMRAAAILLGRKGGKISSPKKTRAVQENGRKGGRPKKSASEDKTDKHSHLPSARGKSGDMVPPIWNVVGISLPRAGNQIIRSTAPRGGKGEKNAERDGSNFD